jgi:hypothetical protein
MERETELLGGKLSHCHSVHMTRPEIEPGPPRWEAHEYPTEPQHGLASLLARSVVPRMIVMCLWWKGGSDVAWSVAALNKTRCSRCPGGRRRKREIIFRKADPQRMTLPSVVRTVIFVTTKAEVAGIAVSASLEESQARYGACGHHDSEHLYQGKELSCMEPNLRSRFPGLLCLLS